MAAAVARGELGIVMSFERSRLSRNDPDWRHLVYLCCWTNPLSGGEQGLHDPSLTNDRMVLGIRGQVSELEHYSAGYALDEEGQLQFAAAPQPGSAVRRRCAARHHSCSYLALGGYSFRIFFTAFDRFFCCLSGFALVSICLLPMARNTVVLAAAS